MNDLQSILATAIKRLQHTSDSAMLDAEVLLSQVLSKPRSHLRARPEKKLSVLQQQQFLKLIEQRYHGVPIAYITGYKEFWSRNFKVGPDVLIPRADTELLVELGLKFLANKSAMKVIDLGTGCGIIAITLAVQRSDLTIIATDFSSQALTIAKQNAKAQQIKNIHFLQSNWFAKVAPIKFDLVISNPPYIATDDPHLIQGDLRFEPKTALIAKNKGLLELKTIIQQAKGYLKLGGMLLIEHGFEQQQTVQDFFKSQSYTQIKTHTDLASNPRATAGIWDASG